MIKTPLCTLAVFLVHHAVKKVEAALRSGDARLEGIIQDIRMTIESNL